MISGGDLVADEIVYKLIEKIISDPKNFNRIIFDGYPRTLSQIYSLEKLLNKFKQKISTVFSLIVDQDTILKRINGRITCTKCLRIFNAYFNPPNSTNHDCEVKYLKKRTDDNTKTILTRIETYGTRTKTYIRLLRKKRFSL